MERRGLFKFPLLNIAIILAITVFFGLFLPKARIDNDVSRTLPKDNPSMLAIDEAKKVFGSSNIMVIGLRTHKDTIITPEYLDMIDKISKECENIAYESGKSGAKSKVAADNSAASSAGESDLLGDFNNIGTTDTGSTASSDTSSGGDESDLLGDFTTATATESVQKDSSDKTPPAAPVNVVVTQNKNGVIITWDAPADADYDHMEINWTPRGEKDPVIVSKGMNKADVPFLDFEEKLKFTLRAVDVNGNKSKSIRENAYLTIPEGYPLVDEVLSLTDVDFIEGVDGGLEVAKMVDREKNGIPTTDEELGAFKKKLAAWDMYRLNIISDDYKSAAIYLKLTPNTKTQHHEQVYKKVMKIVDSYKLDGIDVYTSGLPTITVLVGNFMVQDMARLIPFVLIVVLLTLYSAFKRLGGVILPTLCVVISTVWAVGFMIMMGKRIDLVASVIPVILIAVGSAYGIHIITHYYEKTKGRKNITEAEHKDLVIEIVRDVGLPVALASITTIAGFLSFLTTPIEGMRNFGLFTSFGVFAAVVVALVLIPSILLLRHKALQEAKEEDDGTENHGFITRVLMVIYHYFVKRKYRVLFLTAIIIVIAMFGIRKIHIDSQLIKYFKPATSISKADKFLNQNFGGTNILDVTVKGPGPGSLADPEILHQMDRLSLFLQSKHPEVRKVLGYQDFIKRMNQVMHYGANVTSKETEANMISFIDQLNQAASSVNKSNPDVAEVIDALDRQMNYEGKSFDEIPLDPEKYGVESRQQLKELVSQYLVLYSGNISSYSGVDTLSPDMAKMSLLMSTSESTFTKRVMKDIKDFAAKNFPEGYTVTISGAADITNSLNDLVVNGQIGSFIFSFLVVFLIIALTYRSVIAGLIGVIPLSVAVTINFGLMGLLKIDLNMATATIASIAIGIGVDYTIHFLAAYSLERKKSNDIEQVTKNTMLVSGKAIAFNAASVGLGFAVLVFSNFIPLIHVGILVAVVMFTSSVGAMILLPVILNIFDPKFLRK